MPTELVLPQRQAARQHFYLRLIAAWKGAKGVLLLGVGIALLFLDVRDTWLEGLVAWVEQEMMLVHFNPVLYVLAVVEDFLVGAHLRSIGLLALIYAAVLITEGIGVWFEQRWAEWLMVIATSSLIPFEIVHMLAHPTLVKLGIIAVNVAIVWYLLTVLRRNHAAA